VDSQNPANIKQYRSDRVILFATEEEFQASGCHHGEFKMIFLKNGISGSVVNGYPIPAFNEEPVDDIGAGDAYLASAAIVLAEDDSAYVCAGLIGSVAAAIHCASWGNVTVTREQISDVLCKAA
jgi:sugar/nucleoside kinase (ribokinase family)